MRRKAGRCFARIRSSIHCGYSDRAKSGVNPFRYRKNKDSGGFGAYASAYPFQFWRETLTSSRSDRRRILRRRYGHPDRREGDLCALGTNSLREDALFPVGMDSFLSRRRPSPAAVNAACEPFTVIFAVRQSAGPFLPAPWHSLPAPWHFLPAPWHSFQGFCPSLR
uniref:Uncharacterized protein n=1 Tax=Candidatus Kentrum sp. LPFa TaxID=2126335 RepID=A0A450W4V7_9GAMM|nr:MAG: hypothetical protein BECKLPF1236A_GA0070988_100649 [Candidatus Kentron sp. LPFa]VFK28506.1 MAG: hypothetical protein BECKLPF1236C_GA0070990_100668 [Candidatus Kentron sp. LPFa]